MFRCGYTLVESGAQHGYRAPTGFKGCLVSGTVDAARQARNNGDPRPGKIVRNTPCHLKSVRSRIA